MSASLFSRSTSSGPSIQVTRSTRAGKLGLLAACLLVLALALVPYWAQASTMRSLISFLTLLALAQMWYLLAGYAGLLSVGQQAFIGLGAYSLWALTDKLGVHPFIAVPLAGLVALVAALPAGALAFRLRGGYFAIGTWVIAEVFRLLVANSAWLGGGSGRTVTAASRLAVKTRIQGTYWLALAVALLTVLAVYLLLRSRVGLALTAIRDNEKGAESLGVNVARAKWLVFLASAYGVGVTGAVIYLNLLRIQPDAAFSVNWTAFMIFIVVVGGMGTIEGPILGTVVYFTLQESLASYGSWYLILLGLVAILVTIKAPRGLWGLLTRYVDLQLFAVQRRLQWSRPKAPAGELPQSAGELV